MGFSGFFFQPLCYFLATFLAWAKQSSRVGFILPPPSNVLAVTSPIFIRFQPPPTSEVLISDRSWISQLMTRKFASPPQQVPRGHPADIYPKATNPAAKSPPEIIFGG